MGLDLGSHWKGQFFTPYNVCRMMAEITVADLESSIKEKGWVGIHDPCCGAGALLIAARNTMVRQKLGPRDALYVTQDIDRTAALMCYIQLSLLGCAGYVVVADSLRYPVMGSSPLLIDPMPEQEIWIMPALYDDVWVARIQWERMRLALESLGVMESPKKEPEVVPTQQKTLPTPYHNSLSLNEVVGEQLALF